jgi:hypothetical protein
MQQYAIHATKCIFTTILGNFDATIGNFDVAVGKFAKVDRQKSN